AGLKIGEGAGARDLLPATDSRSPSFQIIGEGAGKSGIAGGEGHHRVRQLQKLKHLFSVAGQERMLVRSILGPAETDQLHLVELMDPGSPHSVFAGGSRLATETRSVRHIPERQLRPVQNLIAMKVGDRHLGGW